LRSLVVVVAVEASVGALGEEDLGGRFDRVVDSAEAASQAALGRPSGVLRRSIGQAVAVTFRVRQLQ